MMKSLFIYVVLLAICLDILQLGMRAEHDPNENKKCPCWGKKWAIIRNTAEKMQQPYLLTNRKLPGVHSHAHQRSNFPFHFYEKDGLIYKASCLCLHGNQIVKLHDLARK
jgi:hypothetical protein